MIINKDRTILPPKISMIFGESGFYNTMPAILPDENIAGVKVVNRYANRQPSLDSQIMLYDFGTGELKAFLDGNYITSMRTGAVAAYTVELLAKSNFSSIGFIGLGNTAQATFLMLMEIYPERLLTVNLLKYKNQHLEFVSKYSKESAHIKFEFCDSYEEVVTKSDVVISSVTYTNKEFCTDDKYKEGCLIIPIHTRGFENCDLFFDKIYADDRDHVSKFKNFAKFKDFSELSKVARGENLGRTDDLQRIMVYNIGIAIHDIFFAEQIFQKAVSSVQVQEVKMNSRN